MTVILIPRGGGGGLKWWDLLWIGAAAFVTLWGLFKLFDWLM